MPDSCVNSNVLKISVALLSFLADTDGNLYFTSYAVCNDVKFLSINETLIVTSIFGIIKL